MGLILHLWGDGLDDLRGFSRLVLLQSLSGQMTHNGEDSCFQINCIKPPHVIPNAG